MSARAGSASDGRGRAREEMDGHGGVGESTEDERYVTYDAVFDSEDDETEETSRVEVERDVVDASDEDERLPAAEPCDVWFDV